MKVSNRISRYMLFEDGIPTIFEEDGKKGIKMGNGERIVPSIYDSIKELDMPTVQYSVELDGRYGVLEIDFNGNVRTKLELEYDLFQRLKYGEYYLVCKNNKYGIWHNDLCLSCEYDEIRLFENNDFLLYKDGKYGLWLNDIKLLPTIYDEIAPPIDDWGIRVKKDGEWGYLDKNYNFTTDISEVPLKWENLDDVSGGISF